MASTPAECERSEESRCGEGPFWRACCHLAYYVDRVLKGSKPADLPIEQPSAFEMVLNLKAARSLGPALPAAVLLRAHRVID